MTARSTTMTMSRRQVLARTGALVTGAAAGWLGVPACLRAAPWFTCPPLPYAEHALAPYLLAPTVSVHYGHHHRDAVNNLNTLVQGTALADMTLEDVIRTTAGDPRHVEIFNNAAQAWNHMCQAGMVQRMTLMSRVSWPSRSARGNILFQWSISLWVAPGYSRSRCKQGLRRAKPILRPPLVRNEHETLQICHGQSDHTGHESVLSYR